MTFRTLLRTLLPVLALLALPMTFTAASAETSTNLPDGLRIIDTVPGTGAVAGPNQTVVVTYVGYIDDDGNRGKKFDASADHGSHSFTFTLGAHDVISGWDEGVTGMKVGGKRTLIVPPDLGYGGKPQGGIPPWSTLIFDIELLEVK